MDNGLDLIHDEDEAFIKTLEEILQQHISHLLSRFLVLTTCQIELIARRLHDTLVPKRDMETKVIQAWTIQPQLQLKVKSSAHIQVLKLSTILREVQKLRVHKSQKLAKGIGPIPLDIFPSLKVIEALNMDILELQYVQYFARQVLELHIEHTNATTLKQLLAPDERLQASPWKKLLTLHMNCCTLEAVDESVNLLQRVRTLDLGWNKIHKFYSTVTVKSLEVLNLCHNQLSIVPPIQALRGLRKLNLAVNQIVSLKGLETLEALERLDVSHNLIHDITEVELLMRLQRLRYLKMEFNPIARRPDYRREVLFYLDESIELDGHHWSEPEISSMKNRRRLIMQDDMKPQNGNEHRLGGQFEKAPVYPRAHVQSGVVVENLKLVLGYPRLPRSQAVPTQFVEIQSPLSTYPTKRKPSQNEYDTESKNRDRMSKTRGHMQSSSDVHPTVRTVDDYFRMQCNVIVSRVSKSSINCEDQATIMTEVDSDASVTGQSRALSRKHSTPDFTRDVENEGLHMREGNDMNNADIKAARMTLQTRVPTSQRLRRRISARVLLSAKDAAGLDLYFGIDGFPANVEIEHQKLVERFIVGDEKDPITITRWLPDVIAIGTSLHANRAKIITMKVQSHESSSVSDAAYQFDSATALEALLSLLVAHLFLRYKSHIVICNCANCGAISLLTPRYSDRIEVNDPLMVYSCLLCSSCNVREVSFKKLVALCANEGIVIPSSIPVGPPLRDAITEGFYIEEPSVTDATTNSSIHECTMVSCNSIREVTATSVKLSSDEVQSDEWNDAIVHAMATSMQCGQENQ